MNRLQAWILGGLAGVFLFTPQFRWVRVKDAYRVHWRYQEREHDGSIYVLGEFYEVERGDMRVTCYPEVLTPRSVASEETARQIVEGCAR